MIIKPILKTIRDFISENGHCLIVGETNYLYLPFWVRVVNNDFPEMCALMKHNDLPSKVQRMAVEENIIIPDTVTSRTIYYYHGKKYTIRGASKMKINDVWTEMIEYRTEYDHPEERNFVRTKEEFFRLFKTTNDE